MGNSERGRLKKLPHRYWSGGTSSVYPRAGQKNVRVTVGSDEIGGNQQVIEKTQQQAYAELMNVANACAAVMIPVRDLTDKQKFAIAMASGVPIDNSAGMNSLVWKLRTRFLCAIAIEEGKYVVYQKPDRFLEVR